MTAAFGGGPVFDRDGAVFEMSHLEGVLLPSDTAHHFPADLPTYPSPQDPYQTSQGGRY
jgi:hypothetical protein